MLYQVNAPTLIRCNVLKHEPELIVFGTHNLQTFEHNTLIKELLLMQFYLFNIRPKLHTASDKNYASHRLSTEETCTRYAV